MARSYVISKDVVRQACQQVKANKGAAGIDEETIQDFEENLKRNLYKIWNRMSSGSYFPPAVKAVAIPKKSGGTRILGIPSISDRIAQTVVKMLLEPQLELCFHPDSYGYRPRMFSPILRGWIQCYGQYYSSALYPTLYNFNRKLVKWVTQGKRLRSTRLLMSIPRKYSVAQVVGYIKGKSAIHIARIYVGRKKNFVGQHFWNRGYFVSTVGSDEEVIRQYIQNQEKADRHLDQLHLM